MALERLVFHLTDRCQLACNHCLRDPGGKISELEIGLVESVMDQAQKLYDNCHVGLTGGEPTMHPEFYRVIDAIAERGFTWHMVSNGERFDEVASRLAERPARLQSLTTVNFSLDGASQETNDAIRAPGSFRAVLKAASVCQARRIPFLLKTTVSARNLREIEQIALLASQLGAKKLSFCFAQPTGTDFDRVLHMPAVKWQQAVDRIDRVRAMFSMECFHSWTGFCDRPFQICEMWSHQTLNVDYQGRLNFCCQHTGVPGGDEPEDIAGDLHDISLGEAHERFSEMVHETIRARLRVLRQEVLDSWDRHFSCNWCLKHHGKPHWTEAGAGGPRASRARQRGQAGEGCRGSDTGSDPVTASVSSGASRPGR